MARMDDGYHSAEERRISQRRGTLQRLSKRQRTLTPPAFADLLISITKLAYLSRDSGRQAISYLDACGSFERT